MRSAPDPAEHEIARLVRGAQNGDRAAFAELYRRFTRMVHGIVLARASRRGNNEVDDLVQDVFLTALERVMDLREPAAFGGWLAAIARHRATDHSRRQPLMEALVNDVAAPKQSDRLEAMAIRDAIRSLPEAYNETLVLRLVE